MKNVVWWVYVILVGLSAIINFYNAGKGTYLRTERPSINFTVAIIRTILFLWGLLTLL